MAAIARRASPTLPGAWASTWALNSACESSDDEEQTAKLSDSLTADHSIHRDHIYYPALSKTPSFRDSKRASRADSSFYGEQASRASSYDNDSNPSDDFYSIISQEDITLLPVILNDPSGKDKQNAEDILSVVEIPEPVFHSPELTSRRLHTAPSQEDVTLFDAVPSKVSVAPSSCSSSSTPDFAMHDAFLNSSSGSRPSSSCARDTPTSTNSRRSSLSAESCSGRSMVFRKNDSDQESTHSNYSGLNYAGVCNLIAQLADGAASEASLPPTRHQTFPRLNNPRQIRRRRIENDFNERQNNEYPLSQPDGNNPWTLSLEPALTATEFTASQSSTASLSINSSDGSENESTPRRYLPSAFTSSRSNSFLQHSPFKFTRANGTRDTEISTTRQGSNNSIYAQPHAENHSNSTPPFQNHVREEPVRSRNVVQKTKDFCNKFKRFLVSKKTPKQKETAKFTADEYLTSERIDADLPPPIQDPLPPASPRTWSFVRRRGMYRSPKMSLPSSQYSASRTEHTIKGSRTSVDKHSYEYHARPKNLEEIRSRRRFSLPAFSGNNSNQYNKSAGQLSSTLSHNHNHRRPTTGSIMTSASQNDSFLMNTLT